jgi:hypothetical protein
LNILVIVKGPVQQIKGSGSSRSRAFCRISIREMETKKQSTPLAERLELIVFLYNNR